ncbi:hypothetical protein SUGI_1028350 [Cryptomeria japonica]|nr:hypothetical protein SUGI_1028350 [Cryptomeria japonica]
MSGGRAFQAPNSADEPQFLFFVRMTTSDVSKKQCRIPEDSALTHFPAFDEESKSRKVVFLDERMNAWRIIYKNRLCPRHRTTNYTLKGGWQQVIEDKDLKSEDCVVFFRFNQSYIFIAIRRTSANRFEVLESNSGEPILLHPHQVDSAKRLATRVLEAQERCAMEYVACIYGMFEAGGGGSQIQGGAASSTASPTLSLQDFEAIYRMFQERANDSVGPIEFEERHLPPRIPRNLCGQDLVGNCRMMEARRILRLNQARSQQIARPTSASSSGNLSPRSLQMLQSTGRQTQALPFERAQAVGATSFPAYPTPSPYIQTPRSHFGYIPHIFQVQTPVLQFAGSPFVTYIFLYKPETGTHFRGDVFQYPEVLRWIGAQIQESVSSIMASQSQNLTMGSLSEQSSGAQIPASAPSFMASQSQYQTSRSLSGQSSGAQTQAGAPSFMASQSQYQTSRSLSEQSSGAQTQAGAPSFCWKWKTL